MLLALATHLRWVVDHIDFVTTFLNGSIDGHDIFVEQPLAYKVGINFVYKMLKALYGLKQSPRIWYQVLHDFLCTEEFARTKADHNILACLERRLMIGVYVDDLLVVGENQEEINQLKKALTTRFKMTDQGPVTHYLGLCIMRNLEAGTMSLTQETYIHKILERFGMQDARGVDTPIAKKDILVYADPSYRADPSTITWYQQSVGSLMYAITETRFDIAFAVSTISQFANNPGPEHVAAVKRIFRYLRKYPSLGITYRKRELLSLHGYVDSDWVMDPITWRSTTGYLFTLAGGVISASSKRQHLVTLSSTKAEYVAYCQATKETVWLRLLLKELGYP